MDLNFNLWYESYDPNFTELNRKSFIPDKWLNYQGIDHDYFENSPIKPINRYVEKLYPKPDLLSITNNVVRLSQKTHAEIFLLDNDPNFNNAFRNLDRPHMRQYYQTKQEFPHQEGCFEPVYLFYVPWFLDVDIQVSFEKPVQESPFFTYETMAEYQQQPRNAMYVEPKFVPFRFRRIGKHMINKDFGKVPRLSPMFDIVFQADDILVERIERFYEKD